ncbi:MAG: AroM family protein [Coprococcus sp.]
MNPIKIGAITIGQAPRTDITMDILPILPDHMILVEYGALDDMDYDEIMAQFQPQPGDEVLVSRMRDGRQVKFTERFITPFVQKKIDQAEADGVSAIILFCTGVFPEFRHHVLFIEPQPLFHAITAKLAGNQRIGILVPEPDQVEQAYHTWGKSGVSIEATSASPYLEFDKVIEAASFFKDKELAFICTDCMGFTMEMKHRIQEATGLPVLLPRTLVVRILCEMFA